MIYGSVCSGIEAASVAWQPLGWEPAFLSEIEGFPCHVLGHRHGASAPQFLPDPDEPDLNTKEVKLRQAMHRARDQYPEINARVSNYGDMTQFQEWPDHGQDGPQPIDLLVGGTPCQSYSVAGLGAGLDDPRGDLTLTYAAIARRYRPRWVVWENVPGVLSNDGGRAFGTFLGLMSGRTVQVPATGWKSAGYIPGIKGAYGIAWRVLDAQFVRVDGFGRAVPQRRRRVFVVGYLGDWRPATAVLFERDSLSRNPAPSRKAREVAPTVPARSTAGGGLGTDFDCDGGVVTHSLRGEGFDASEDGTGRGTPLVTETIDTVGVSPAIKARDHKGPSSDGDGDGAPILPVAFSSKDHGGDAAVDLSPTVRSVAGYDDNGGGPPAIAFDTTQITSKANFSNPKPSDPCHPLAAQAHVPTVAYGFEDRARGDDGRGYDRSPHFSEEVAPTAGTVKPPSVAYDMRGREDGAQLEGPHDTANVRASSGGSSRSYLATSWAVRRLTPIETSRLQGFDDHYTQIPWRGKPAAECPDGPQYKSHGNSMAVPVMRWIGRRIEVVEKVLQEKMQ